jgi:hypothetical protein
VERKRYGPYRSTNGYMYWWDQYPNGKSRQVWVHREVAAEMVGRRLGSEEHVHHKNRIPWDNRPENLEVLPRSIHLAQHGRRSNTFLTIICPMCGKEAVLRARFVRHNRKQGKAGPFCGKSCAGKWSHLKTWPLEPPGS